MNRLLKLGIEDRIPVLFGVIGSGSENVSGDSGVVERAIQPPINFHCPFDQMANGILPGNVGLNECRFAAFVFDQLDDLLALFNAASGDDDFGPGSGKFDGGHFAYA